ncbi:66 kDa stress protein [Tribonema minus]|uniref:66 kDa stress protein n=1 Tax=Tribonema minus TaxID=303371 RepID=A0A836C9B9_9STRA|nr:66 kDa stress protein [Tribonema minus]
MANLVKPCIDNPSFLGHFIPNPSTVRGNNFHMGVHPKQPNKIVYPSGKFIIVRDLDDPAAGFVYRGHNAVATVAKFSPSGCWVASGDTTGKVRVWSWDNPEHGLKAEINAIAGPVKDLAWDSESKRIVAVGEGGVNMRAFTWDTGNNLGELVGHAKGVLSVDYRQARPFKIMTASEDMRTLFFKGPPFSMDHSNKDQHSNFVNVVRFSPDGARIATAGSDYKVWIYDGTTGEPVHELGAAHTGSIFGLSWCPDSNHLVTASADKTCRLWNVDSKAVEHTWTFADAPEVGDMQVSCVTVSADHAASVSVRGDISLLDLQQERPAKVISAHQVAVTAMSPSTLNGALVTGSFDGVVCAWAANGVATRLQGQLGAKTICGAAHSNKVSGIAVSAAGIVSVGWDDTIRLAPAGGHAYTESASLNGQPCGVSANAGSELAAVVTSSGVAVYRKTALVAELSVNYTPKSVSLFGESEVAVGGDDGIVRIYALSGSTLTETKALPPVRGAAASVAFSPDGAHLAVGDSQKEIVVYARAGGAWDPLVQGLWQFHTSTVAALAWSPDNTLLASGGPDETIYVWSIAKPRKRITYKFAHRDGISGLCWVDADTLASAGGDHCVARWDVGKEKGATFA